MTNTIEKYGKNKTRLLDMLIDMQRSQGCITKENISMIARETGISEAGVRQTMSFYHFFTSKPTGKYTIYLNNSVVAKMMGGDKVLKAFEEEAGIRAGNVTEDGLIGLFETSDIGMNDQEPAALINWEVFPNLTPYRVREIIRDIHNHKAVKDILSEGLGDGNNSHPMIASVINNHIRKRGPVLDYDHTPGDCLKKATGMKPGEIIDEIKESRIRGRGGAGFPTGLKWEFCRKSKGEIKYIFCNADEGEPGTFKDRVILTEHADLLFEGMALAGYAVGAREGILYIRYEYKYLEKYLLHVLDKLRNENLLGKNAAGLEGFDFDIRIQYGAGAYVCGEESALIESAEGKRGEPRDRPPFPVERGYLGKPTVVNNVETFCSAVKILLRGGDWYNSLGTPESTGTKLLSISGDCRYPGVYEVEWGFSIYEILEMVGAREVQAVQVGGPSGTLLNPSAFRRILGYEDLSTGGSFIIFNKSRDLIRDVVLNFTRFFIEESCGACSICRIVPVLLEQKLSKILKGRGTMQDIDELIDWGRLTRANRCGLGQTAANPILSSIKNFRNLYEENIQMNKDFDGGFDLSDAIREACEATGRTPVI